MISLRIQLVAFPKILHLNQSNHPIYPLHSTQPFKIPRLSYPKSSPNLPKPAPLPPKLPHLMRSWSTLEVLHGAPDRFDRRQGGARHLLQPLRGQHRRRSLGGGRVGAPGSLKPTPPATNQPSNQPGLNTKTNPKTTPLVKGGGAMRGLKVS